MAATAWTDFKILPAAVRVQWCLILLRPFIVQRQTALRAWIGGQGGQGILAASRTETKCQRKSSYVLVPVSICWQVLGAVPASRADSECQRAGKNPFDFSKLGRLSESHQPSHEDCAKWMSAPLPTTTTTSKASASSLLVRLSSECLLTNEAQMKLSRRHPTLRSAKNSCGAVLTLLHHWRISLLLSDLIEVSHPLVFLLLLSSQFTRVKRNAAKLSLNPIENLFFFLWQWPANISSTG